MPQGNNPAEDRSSAENRIDKESAGQKDTVKKAYNDVQTLKEQIEKLKAQANKLSSTPAAPANQAETVRVSSDVKEPVDLEAAKAAEEVVRKQAEKDLTETVESMRRKREERQAKIQEAIEKENRA